MKKTAVIIFIKNPELGRVKKRLAKTIGDEKALEIYIQMLEHTQSITKSLNTDKFLYYDKEIIADDVWPNDIYQKRLQSGSDMASRIHQAFKETFEQGYKQVVIVGSDCLELDERVIRLAYRQLEHFDCVLGPTKDGGFYLFGMNNLYSEIFKVKGWGTPHLADEVLRTINQLNKTCFMLSELAGVITVEDLNENIKQLVK